MKIALYARNDNSNLEQIKSLMSALAIEFEHNPCDTKGFDMAISLGGDGTFLSAVRDMGSSVGGSYLPLFGINSGRLGFLSSAQLSGARDAFEALIAQKYNIEERAMLEIQGVDRCQKTKALNEFTVQKSGTSMIFIELKINDISVASYWADGIIVSTPTGSTAYSMSVGGAILTPGSHCFIISPIAPHNLSLRPIVVPDTSTIEVKVASRHNEKQITATIDNCEYTGQSKDCFIVTRSHDNLQVVNLLGTNFYNTLREKLHWGIDLR